MKVKVEFLGPINKESMEININSLDELKTILNEDKSLKKWLEVSAISINGKIISSLDYKLQDNDIISIIPPVSGG